MSCPLDKKTRYGEKRRALEGVCHELEEDSLLYPSRIEEKAMN